MANPPTADSSAPLPLHLDQLRQDYQLKSLDIGDVQPAPLAQLQQWLQEAIAAQMHEPNAMVVSTVAPTGQPSGRIVLLKGMDTGLIFYTNYHSRKGQELAQNPLASATFWWDVLERQVRIEGRMEQIAPALSDAYFQSRPRGSQIGAQTSPQSEQVSSRKILEEREQQVVAQFEGQDIPRPTHWGGYRLVPHYFEFWQGRRSRLHDRITYTRQADNTWALGRLAP
jgi:pyridoxamine 5'-phosphate oxidase